MSNFTDQPSKKAWWAHSSSADSRVSLCLIDTMQHRKLSPEARSNGLRAKASTIAINSVSELACCCSMANSRGDAFTACMRMPSPLPSISSTVRSTSCRVTIANKHLARFAESMAPRTRKHTGTLYMLAA